MDDLHRIRSTVSNHIREVIRPKIGVQMRTLKTQLDPLEAPPATEAGDVESSADAASDPSLNPMYTAPRPPVALAATLASVWKATTAEPAAESATASAPPAGGGGAAAAAADPAPGFVDERLYDPLSGPLLTPPPLVEPCGSGAPPVGAPSVGAPSVGGTPDGFDVQLAIRLTQLCGATYHSLAPTAADGEAERSRRLKADLAAHGLDLVREIRSDVLDTYAVIASSSTDVVLLFRGSCTARNVLSDLDYQPTSAEAVARYAEESGLPLPAEVRLHNGFLDAWRSLRPQVLEAIDELVEDREIAFLCGGRDPSGGLKLQVSGHSLGGPMSMLASLEIAYRMRERQWEPFATHTTYTLAAPRLGNAAFARYYESVFRGEDEHWALQLENDAVPHLPFAAWGYRHPRGIAVLTEGTASDAADEVAWGADLTDECAAHAAARERAASRTTIRASPDRGDTAALLRPRDGNPVSWATHHNLMAYLRPLEDMHAACETEACELPLPQWDTGSFDV